MRKKRIIFQKAPSHISMLVFTGSTKDAAEKGGSFALLDAPWMPPLDLPLLIVGHVWYIANFASS